MWLFSTYLLFFYIFPGHNCIVVITSKRNEKPRIDANFVIPNLDLSSHDTFTMCGRFNIYQFIIHSKVVSGKYVYNETFFEGNEFQQGIFPGFGTYSLFVCDEVLCDLIPSEDRKLKHVFVWLYLFGEIKIFPTTIKPNTWNSFCLNANSTTSVLRINGDMLITHNDKRNVSAYGYYNYGNYSFMNDPAASQSISAMYGSVTDINIWDRILSEKKIDNWINCSVDMDGNVYSWRTSSQYIQLNGLEKVNDSLENICYSTNSSNLFLGNEDLNFEDALNYCNKIGSMKEISSNETAIEVAKALESATRWEEIFTGYTDIEVEGLFVLHSTEENMTFTNWADGQPNNIGDNQDCVTMFFSDLELYDYPCHTKLQPVCNIAEVNHIYMSTDK